jgi:hypothetical protein
VDARSIFAAALVGSLVVAASDVAQAQRRAEAERFVLEDAIAVEIIDHEIVAFDLEGSGRLAMRLERNEEVLFYGSRGRVAVVLTTQRMLGATPVSASWQEERYRLTERPLDHAILSQSLALVVTPQRALAFFGTGNWAEQTLGPREYVITSELGPAAGVVVTQRRALGISTETGGFFETKLRLKERIESVRAISSIATITTSQRTLIFKGPSGLWVEHDRKLH